MYFPHTIRILYVIIFWKESFAVINYAWISQYFHSLAPVLKEEKLLVSFFQMFLFNNYDRFLASSYQGRF